MFLRNTGIYLRVHTASQPRRTISTDSRYLAVNNLCCHEAQSFISSTQQSATAYYESENQTYFLIEEFQSVRCYADLPRTTLFSLCVSSLQAGTANI
jgi:hypothetical protein